MRAIDIDQCDQKRVLIFGRMPVNILKLLRPCS